MNQVSVTACLTAYNASAFIQPVLESLKAQTWPQLRILISDDCSEDDTADLIRRFAEDDQLDIEIFQQKQRLGWVGNTNFLLDRIQTDYFFVAYHDDVIATDYVTSLMDRLLSSTEAVGACSDISLKTLEGETVLRAIDPYFQDPDALQRGVNILGMHGFPWVANRGVFQTNALKRVGGLRRNLAGDFSAAFPWVLGMALEGQILRVPRALVNKTHHPSGITAGWKKTYREFFAMYVDIFETIWRSSLDEASQRVLLGACNEVCSDLIGEARLSIPKDLSGHIARLQAPHSRSGVS